MRNKLIAGNWKMFNAPQQTRELIEKLVSLKCFSHGPEVVVAPPFISLAAAKDAIGRNPIGLAAQNVFWEEKGAFTGEVAPSMLVAAGCQWVIIGHSERRQYFGETDATVNKRVAAALKAGLKPVVCVGETLAEREANATSSVVGRQLDGGFAHISPASFDAITIAYEPVWAIGTGKTATPAQAQETHSFIRGWLEKNPGPAAAKKTRILYGGSVKPANSAELMGLPDVDGALVGGASLIADDFNDIIRLSVKR